MAMDTTTVASSCQLLEKAVWSAAQTPYPNCIAGLQVSFPGMAMVSQYPCPDASVHNRWRENVRVLHRRTHSQCFKQSLHHSKSFQAPRVSLTSRS